ncbi:MAG: hypothetical protein QME48_05945 [bacterium]|uniref:SGNH hydrolase-type esterase domain-containing protein n=2 Tax=Bacteria candidate phyla TaxID=1783234 RepID=A0A101I0M9_UNCT6|nr:MAG: hypothetical protein XD76_0229 [candidate division TA06 bacterium 32_111]KUK86852.1 MAG: hypothetical protein XE03_1215 [candidate division TA06 bacterium 34_109]MDI6700759.1 hypothetical protein [bacterium]HAF07309.1 hypothetical protein [candidate division WOR-3 bacterium]HCP16457.1 hypothetical protein [candidate division WOR-3 bacterium]
MKRFIKLFFLYFFIIFLSVEIFLRLFFFYFERYSSWEERSGLFVYDSLIGWRGAPNRRVHVKTFESKFLVKTDSLGFRNLFYKGEKKGRKVLMYGDSFLWGYHLNNEELISSRLSEELDVEVKNYGMIGYGTDQEYILFRGSVEDSSLVVFFFYLNDLRDILHDNLDTPYKPKPKFIIRKDSLILTNCPVGKNREKVETEKRNIDLGIRYRLSELLKKILYKSFIVRIIFSNLQYNSFGKLLYEKNLMEIPEYMKSEWDIPNCENIPLALRIYEKIILEVKRECKERGCDLIVFMIPSEWTYQRELQKKLERLRVLYGYNDRYEEVMDSVENILKRNGIRYIYPLEDFRRMDAKRKLTKKFDKHFSKEGAEFVKEILRREIEKSF